MAHPAPHPAPPSGAGCRRRVAYRAARYAAALSLPGVPVRRPSKRSDASTSMSRRTITESGTEALAMPPVAGGRQAAGRQAAATKAARGRNIQNELLRGGVVARSRSREGLAEEQPQAYKDVDVVVDIEIGRAHV